MDGGRRNSRVLRDGLAAQVARVAVDAPVITLIHPHDSPVGQRWQLKANELAATKADK